MDSENQQMVAALAGTPKFASMTNTMRPSSNVEDHRDKTLGQKIVEQVFEMSPEQMGVVLHHPMTPYWNLFPQNYGSGPQNLDTASSFGLPNTATALSALHANPPAIHGPGDDQLGTLLGQWQSYP